MTNLVLHATSTLLQVSQVLPASRVPRRHVLLHAVCEGGLLGRRDGRAGVGDGALEAVLVDFLQWGISIHLRDDGLPLEGGITGGEELEVCIATYVDEEAGVLQRSLLADLLHDFGLCVEGHFG